ncbi:hypothetical protein BKA83DRAFT_4561583 [Pisolithus microcarpus]|nr:hypothetical protein BKA83DRAFT_4561583 [Pisolithus microcarpus]
MISDNPTHRLDLYVSGKYRLGQKITSGSFGNIYLRINIISRRRSSSKHPQLEYEPKVYESGQWWFSMVCNYNAMVLGLLDPFPEDLFNLCSHEFSLKTATGQPLAHKCMLMGIGRQGNQTNTIGLGLATGFCDSRTHPPIPYRKNKNLAGTARHPLTNSLLGVEQVCHDDLESLACFVMYFLCGAPPWQVLYIATRGQKYGPFNHTQALRFDDNHNYYNPCKPFCDPPIHEGFQYDYIPDWSI